MRSDHTHRRAPLPGQVLLASCGIVAGTCDAQPGMDSAPIANVELNAELGPLDLPGQKRAPRPREATPHPEPPPGAQAPRDWFGHAPFWEWSRATGDWAGGRTALEDAGITIEGSYILDWSSVWDGGVRHKAFSRSALDINASFDSSKLAGYDGGTLFVNYLSTDGRGGSDDAGDIQIFDNIQTADNIDEIAQLWYEQQFLDGTLRFKIGKIDANTEFGSATPASAPQHTAAAFSPTIALLPTWPDASTGALVFWSPTEQWYGGAGFFDGSIANGNNVGRLGPAPLFRGQEFFYIGEIGFAWKAAGSLGRGRVAGGVWHSTADLARFDGGTEDNTTGAYVVAEQQVWFNGDNSDDECKGLWLFGQYGQADDSIFAIGNHLGFGAALFGTFENRDSDEAGLYVSLAGLSGDAAAGFDGDETAYEMFYKFQITPFASIRPSVIFISNPSGSSLDDATVGMLRFELAF